MATVYVPQFPPRNSRNWVPDLTPAAEFGNLKYIFEADELFVGRPTTLLARAINELKNFNSKEDYIVWPPSSPLSLVTVVMALCHNNVWEINVLQWDRIRGTERGIYVPVRLSIPAAVEVLH